MMKKLSEVTAFQNRVIEKSPTIEQCVSVVTMCLQEGMSHDGAVNVLEQLLALRDNPKEV